MRVHRTPIGFLVSYSWREVQKKARKAIGPVARGDEDHDGDNDDARDRAGGGSFFRRLRDPHVFLRTLKAVPWVLWFVHGGWWYVVTQRFAPPIHANRQPLAKSRSQCTKRAVRFRTGKRLTGETDRQYHGENDGRPETERAKSLPSAKRSHRLASVVLDRFVAQWVGHLESFHRHWRLNSESK